jgi:peroxiredoxin
MGKLSALDLHCACSQCLPLQCLLSVSARPAVRLPAQLPLTSPPPVLPPSISRSLHSPLLPRSFSPPPPPPASQVAQLLPQFTRRGVKVLALSCNSTESHHRWAIDVLAVAKLPTDRGFPYPIIADPTRQIATRLGMIDGTNPQPGMPLTCRAVLVFAPDKTLKLQLLYPASSGTRPRERRPCGPCSTVRRAAPSNGNDWPQHRALDGLSHACLLPCHGLAPRHSVHSTLCTAAAPAARGGDATRAPQGATLARSCARSTRCR